MPLSMKLWLALEDDVARHKAEIAQAFAQARDRLLPEPVSVWPEAAKAARDLWAISVRVDDEGNFAAEVCGGGGGGGRTLDRNTMARP